MASEITYLSDMQGGLTEVLRSTTNQWIYGNSFSITRSYVHEPRGLGTYYLEKSGMIYAGFTPRWMDTLEDGLGSIRAEINHNSQVIAGTRTMNPYGDVMTDYNYGTMDSGYGFTGEQVDPNELVYLRARYYDPNIGNFVSLDPFEGKTCTPMSLNGYSWVEGNVANWVDATGMCLTPNICESIVVSSNPTLLYLAGCYDSIKKIPRTPLTAELPAPANDVIPQVRDCSLFPNTQPIQQACETLKEIQNWWSNLTISGPMYGEIVALVIGSEWYAIRDNSGQSGPCTIRLGDVLPLVMSHQFWFWDPRVSYTPQNDTLVIDRVINLLKLNRLINFLSYFQPIREQRIGNNPPGSIFNFGVMGSVPHLFLKIGWYAQNDMMGYLRDIFNPANPYKSAVQPGKAILNCPYGFANFDGSGNQSYAKDDVLVSSISGDNFNVVSFAQDSINPNDQPDGNECPSFQRLRANQGCSDALPGRP